MRGALILLVGLGSGDVGSYSDVGGSSFYSSLLFLSSLLVL